jgi:hypothetical protein
LKPGSRILETRVLVLAFAGLITFTNAAARADVVEQADGTWIEGRILKETDDFVVLVTREKRRVVIPRRKIRRVMKGIGLIDIYVGRRAALEAGDAGAHHRLGLWCEQNGMRGLARREFLKTVALDPEHAGARAKLGHRKWEGRWYESEAAWMEAKGLVPFRGAWLTPAQREEKAEGFRAHGGDWFTDAEWERIEKGGGVILPGADAPAVCRTRHYRFATHLGEAKTLKFGRMAEQAFEAFETHFGFAPEGVLEGRLFASLSDFGEFAVGRGFAQPGALFSHGFFDGGTRKIYFPYIDDDYTTVNILIHELCHQFEVLGMPGGRIPSWYFEGIACVFAHHAWDGKDLRTAQLQVRRNFNLYYLQQLLRTKKALRLESILKGDPGPRVDPVFYHHAWGLAWFLMHDEKGGYASRFQAYEKALHTKDARAMAPVALFVRHFGDLETVEKDFQAYIGGIRGIPWRGEGRPAGSK